MPLEFEKLADAQSNNSEMQDMCEKFFSIQNKNLPIENSNKVILCDLSQSKPRVLLRAAFRHKAFDKIHSKLCWNQIVYLHSKTEIY